jgi:hypothetical protein
VHPIPVTGCPSSPEPAVRNPQWLSTFQGGMPAQPQAAMGVPGPFLDLVCSEWEMGATLPSLLEQSLTELWSSLARVHTPSQLFCFDAPLGT